MKRVLLIKVLFTLPIIAQVTAIPSDDSLTSPLIWVAKVDSTGQLVRTSIYEGMLPLMYGSGHSIAQITSDGCVIIAGSSLQPDLSIKLYVMKLDCEGDSIWTKTYAREDGGTDYYYRMYGNKGDSTKRILAHNLIGQAVVETLDKGYLVLAEMSVDSIASKGHPDPVYYFEGFMLIKIDSLGEKQWRKTYDVGKDEMSCDISLYLHVLPDSSFVIRIDRRKHPNKSLVMGVDSKGDIQWRYNYKNYFIDIVRQTPFGEFLILTKWNVCKRKIQKRNSQWETMDEYVIGEGTEILSESNLKQEGYFWLKPGGKMDKSNVSESIRVLKSDDQGRLYWRKCIDFSWNATNYCIQITSDGGCIVADLKEGIVEDFERHRTNDYGPSLLRLNSQGNVEWQMEYPQLPVCNQTRCIWICQSANNGYIFVSTVQPPIP